MQAYYWLIALAVLLVIEILTLGLTTIWFAGGALLAFFISLSGGGLPLQILVFFITSIILLFFTRPIAFKYLNNHRVKTNYESIIGKEGRVTELIDNFNQSGTVLLDGQEWTARSFEDSHKIEQGTKVRIIEIQGVKLIVTDKEEEEV